MARVSSKTETKVTHLLELSDEELAALSHLFYSYVVVDDDSPLGFVSAALPEPPDVRPLRYIRHGGSDDLTFFVAFGEAQV